MCFICDRIDLIKRGENPYFVKELETGYVVIGDNQRFYGYTLFLCKQHVSEIFDLDPEFRAKHLTEMSLVAQAVSAAFPCDKMNYECLGNGESHVHWHLYPRRAGDLGEYGVNGKGPVWWLPVESRWWESDRIGGDPLEEMKAKLLSELNQLQ